MQCFRCDKEIVKPWTNRTTNGNDVGAYCSKTCAVEDAVGPVFRIAKQVRRSKAWLKDYCG